MILFVAILAFTMGWAVGENYDISVKPRVEHGVQVR